MRSMSSSLNARRGDDDTVAHVRSAPVDDAQAGVIGGVGANNRDVTVFAPVGGSVSGGVDPVPVGPKGGTGRVGDVDNHLPIGDADDARAASLRHIDRRLVHRLRIRLIRRIRRGVVGRLLDDHDICAEYVVNDAAQRDRAAPVVTVVVPALVAPLGLRVPLLRLVTGRRPRRLAPVVPALSEAEGGDENGNEQTDDRGSTHGYSLLLRRNVL